MREEEVVTYAVYYQHIMKFVDSSEPYFLNSTLTYCKTDTLVCENFTNICAQYVDPNVWDIYEGRETITGELLPAPTNFTSASNNVLEEDTRIRMLVPIENYFSGHILEYELTVVEVKPNDTKVEISDRWEHNQ